MSLMTHAFDRWQGKAAPGQRRHKDWPKTKRGYKKVRPNCEACGRGGRWSVDVHHIIPFQLAPDLELDPENLITLCTGKLRGGGCHLLLGHGMSFRTFNPSVRSMSALVRTMIENVRRVT